MCEMKGKKNKMYFKYNQHHQPSAAYSQNTFVVIVFIDCYYYYYNRQSNIIESARRSAQPPTFHVPRQVTFALISDSFSSYHFIRATAQKTTKLLHLSNTSHRQNCQYTKDEEYQPIKKWDEQWTQWTTRNLNRKQSTKINWVECISRHKRKTNNKIPFNNDFCSCFTFRWNNNRREEEAKEKKRKERMKWKGKKKRRSKCKKHPYTSRNIIQYCVNTVYGVWSIEYRMIIIICTNRYSARRHAQHTETLSLSLCVTYM